MRRSYLTLVGVCTFWGTIPLLARRVDLPAPGIVFVRVWVAAAGLAVAVAVDRYRRRPEVETDRGDLDLTATAAGRTARHRTDLGSTAPGRVPFPSHHRLRALAAGLLLAVHWTAMFAAYSRAPDDTVAFVVFLAPVGVALLAPRLLGEALGPRTLAALALAVAGFVLVAGPSVRGSSPTGVAMAVLSAVTLVLLVIVSKPLAAAYGGLRLTLVQMTVAGVALVPAAFTVDWRATPSAWGWLVVLGLLHTALAMSLYLAALARLPATSVGILGYLEPFSVVLLSWVFLSETPRPATLVGGFLIVAGVAVLASGRPSGSLPRSMEVPARAAG